MAKERDPGWEQALSHEAVQREQDRQLQKREKPNTPLDQKDGSPRQPPYKPTARPSD